MNNYCKKCRLRDGCLRKCKEAEVYEQGYNDAYDEIGKALRMCKQRHRQRGNQRVNHQRLQGRI